MSLKATLELVDKVSDRFNTMATTGKAALSDIQQYSSSASTAYDKLSKVVSQSDLNSIEKSCNAAGTSLKDMRDSTLEWTDAASNYNKEALEMMNTDEELVEQGLKIKSAVTEAADSVEDMGDAAKDTTDDVKGLGEEVEKTSEETEGFGDKSKTAIGDLDQIIASAGIVTGLKQIADGFKECTANSEELESMTAKLETISGSSAVGGLATEVKQLSSETGKYATDLTDVAYNAISAGTAVEESVNMAKTASELATAGFTNEASALSVLETAMNSYGDQIESVSDVSDSLITVQNLGVTTVDQLAANMGKAISTAAAYNVSLGNVESGYISITKAGISTAEGTTYLSGMLNELGNTGSEIGKVLKEETGQSFGQLMNEGQSLADVLGVVYDRVGRNSEAMINMFGSQEAGKAAMAIINQGLDQFNNNLKAVENSTGATASAYAIMADTTEFAHNRMNNSAKNLSIVIGDQLNSSLKGIYSVTADIFDMVGSGLEKAPAVTAIITGATVGVAALTIGVTGYSAATKIADMVTKAWAASASLNPIFGAVAVITGVVTAMGVLINVMKDANEEYNSLTAASKEQYNELQRMQTQYDEVAAAEGETSDKAVELATNIEIATGKFEASRMTLEEWHQTVDDAIQKHDDLIDNYKELTKSQAVGDYTISQLTDKYSTLADKTDLTLSEQTELGVVVDLLNSKVEGLGLTFDKTTGKTNKSAEDIKKYYDTIKQTAYVDAAKKQYEEFYNALGENLLEEEQAKTQLDAAQRAYDEAEAAYAEHVQNMTDMGQSAGTFDLSHWAYTHSAKKELEEAQEAYDKLVNVSADYEAQIEDIQSKLDGTADTIESTGNAATDAFNQVVTSTTSEVMELIDAYNEAYEAAYDSIDGQIGLFDKMQTKSELSVSQMQTNLQSQIDYLNTYTENLSKAAELGFSDSLISSLSDGTEQSAGYLNALVSQAESLGKKGPEAATEFVEGFNSKMEQVESAKEKWSTQVGKMETDFDEKMDGIQSRMNQAVSDMDMSGEAAKSAKNTIDAYIRNIEKGTDGATNAASAVAKATAAALNNTSVSPSIPGHASGTTYGESAYIAGEAGPELILDKAGSTVFPHSETMKIVEAVGDMYYDASPTELTPYYTAPAVNTSTPVQSAEKTIHIEINGTGKMSFSGNVDKEQIVEVMQNNLKDVLLNIVSEEIAEEGDGSYEY